MSWRYGGDLVISSVTQFHNFTINVLYSTSGLFVIVADESTKEAEDTLISEFKSSLNSDVGHMSLLDIRIDRAEFNVCIDPRGGRFTGDVCLSARFYSRDTKSWRSMVLS